MVIAGILTLLSIAGWMLASSSKAQDAAKLSCIIAIFIIWGSFGLMKLNDWQVGSNHYIYLIIIPVLLFVIWRVSKTAEKTVLTIIAKQQSYWNIPPKVIRDFYKSRLDDKGDRIEVSVDEKSKRFAKDMSDARPSETTTVSNLDEVRAIPIYGVILQRVERCLKQLEKRADLEEDLRVNNNCAEYFLMDIWERYTKSFNVGVANLDIFAQDEKQKQLIHAIDTISLSSVKPEGHKLVYEFLEVKGRLPKPEKPKEPKVLQQVAPKSAGVSAARRPTEILIGMKLKDALECGESYSYEIEADENVWGREYYPSYVLSAQLTNPDASKIALTFHDTAQKVWFEHGVATKIEKI
jgi:hypothetical protein